MSAPLPADVTAALEVLVRALSVPDADPWVDAAHAEIPQRAIRDAVRRGDLAGHRVARKLLVRRSELDRFIAAHRVTPAKRAAPTDNVRQLLGSGRRVSASEVR